MSPKVQIDIQLARRFGLLALALLAIAPAAAAAVTESKGVVAVVNDQPITSFDVEQRINLGRPTARWADEALEALAE
jgi:parvulin-like peptidyl-prolyl isomerase